MLLNPKLEHQSGVYIHKKAGKSSNFVFCAILQQKLLDGFQSMHKRLIKFFL